MTFGQRDGTFSDLLQGGDRDKHSVYKREFTFGGYQPSSIEYFSFEELEETAGGKAYDPNLELKICTYSYKSGAVYKGQMRGGYRDGKGVMTWPDKAKYDGQWKAGNAQGNGTFYHYDGGVYTG